MAPAELRDDTTETLPLGSITSKLGRILRTPATLLALAACAIGCAGPDDQPVLTTVSSAGADPKIFGGARDDDDQAVKGVVALRVGAAGTFELCSGALLAPNVVL